MVKQHRETVNGMPYNMYYNREYKKYYNTKGKFKRQVQYFQKKYGEEIDSSIFENTEIDIETKIENIKMAVENLKQAKYMKKYQVC